MLTKFTKFSAVLIITSLVLAACAGGVSLGNNDPNNAGNADTSSDNSTNDSGTTTNNPEVESVSLANLAPISVEALLDPAIASSSDTAVLQASSFLYDTLVREVDGEIVAGLAVDWSISDDGLTYSFRLRPNAVFTDGTPLNTDTVVANFTRWFDPESNLHGDSSRYEAWVNYFDDFLVRNLEDDQAPPSKFDGIEKDDNLVFLIHLNEQMDDFLSIIALPQFSILNPTALAASDYGTVNGSIVGTGAYQVDTWDADGLALIQHNNFWGTPGSVDKVSFPGE